MPDIQYLESIKIGSFPRSDPDKRPCFLFPPEGDPFVLPSSLFQNCECLEVALKTHKPVLGLLPGISFAIHKTLGVPEVFLLLTDAANSCQHPRPHPHRTRAHKFERKSFDDVAFVQCGHSNSHQQVSFAGVARARPVWMKPKGNLGNISGQWCAGSVALDQKRNPLHQTT